MSYTFIVYYIQTNLIAILFIAFIFYAYTRDSRGLTESKWFLSVLVTIQVYCIMDIFAALFKNQSTPGARTILWISNTIYVAIPLILVIFWNYYIAEHIREYYHPGKVLRYLDKIIPAISVIICVIALSTPLTHSTFYLDEQNGYHRTIGAYLVPAYAYLFMIYETVKLQMIRKDNDSLQIKQDTNILSWFGIPCILFSVTQVFLYGTTLSQIGFTMAIMIIYLGRQRNSISRDELTGLNNRREYEYAIDHLARNSGNVMLIMIDVNRFKSINDTFGHLEGDNALKAVSLILKRSCSNRKELGSIGLYRYGGDEFCMISTELNNEAAKELIMKTIHDETEKWNSESQKPYTLSLSVGIVYGHYSEKEIYSFIDQADKEMYIAKAKR